MYNLKHQLLLCLSLAQALVSHGLCPEHWFFMGPFCACTIKTGRHVDMQTIEGDIWYFWHRTTQAICQAMCQAIVFHGHARGQEILHEGPTIETEGGVLWYPVVLRLELLYPQKMIQILQNTNMTSWNHVDSCGKYVHSTRLRILGSDVCFVQPKQGTVSKQNNGTLPFAVTTLNHNCFSHPSLEKASPCLYFCWLRQGETGVNTCYQWIPTLWTGPKQDNDRPVISSICSK